MEKERLDVLIATRGLAESRSQAQRLVMAGQVRVNGQVVLKSSTQIPKDERIEIERGPRFVSRGGEKLEAALLAFGLDNLQDQVCVDVGASTGGFTDCLLQHGAARVYAVDVGYGLLHWKLRRDPRVISQERTNARFVSDFPELIQLVTVDASFISLRILLPTIRAWFRGGPGQVITLIKPQFEAGREDAARGEGVIKDKAIHRQVLLSVLEQAQKMGFGVQGLIRSPLLGPKGNIEFLAHLILPDESAASLPSLVGLVEAVLS
ncbi:MAG: TlyA family RNA methyltransferase [Anaerolineaceae bacterium]|jgi:23S rRNA (cytidine1920-2'-O)/16S rRNA (cytidine1409-2'-O)-methyltransferase